MFYRTCKTGIPVTYYVGIGTDFASFCYCIAQLDGGVHLDISSAVTGAEVFQKALSIARNQGYPTFDITTANFDSIPLGDYRSGVGKDQHDYYLPRKMDGCCVAPITIRQIGTAGTATPPQVPERLKRCLEGETT